jgi:DNA-binding transcriptional regulator GbsR (MarR family)
MRVNDLHRTAENPLDIFIKGWGRMGIYWGVGKVMAEIQALLYLSPRPLCLDEMSRRLKTSRSNVSLNVRALQDLGVVRKVIIPGDRKDYYTAETELELVARRLAAAKKRRELDPALEVVRKAIEAANAAAAAATAAPDGTTAPGNTDSAADESNGAPRGGNGSIDTERLRNLRELMEKINGIFEMFIDEKTGGRRQTERPNNP